LTRNAWIYVKSRAVRNFLADHGIRHLTTKPYRPRTNRRVERFHRTMAREWAYGLVLLQHPAAPKAHSFPMSDHRAMAVIEHTDLDVFLLCLGGNVFGCSSKEKKLRLVGVQNASVISCRHGGRLRIVGTRPIPAASGIPSCACG
jgi:hypothetical protein